MPIPSLIVLVALVRRSWRLRLRARPVFVIVLVMLLLSHCRLASSCSCALLHLHHRVRRACCSSLVCYRRRHPESLAMRARASRAMYLSRTRSWSPVPWRRPPPRCPARLPSELLPILRLRVRWPRAALRGPSDAQRHWDSGSYPKGEQWQPALSLLSEMWVVKLEPDIMSHSPQNSACENRKQWQPARSLLSDM